MVKILENIKWLLFFIFMMVCTASIGDIFNLNETSLGNVWIYWLCLAIIFFTYMGLSAALQNFFIGYKYEERKKRYYILQQERKIYYIFPILYIGVSMYLIYYGYFILDDIIEMIGGVIAFAAISWFIGKMKDEG